jgi:hypothetical protein
VSWSRAPTSYTVINSDLVQGVKRCQDACPGKSCKIYQWSLGTGRYDALYAASLCVSNRPKGCK